MVRRNTSTLLPDEKRESRLREHTEALVNEAADVLLREAERATEMIMQPHGGHRQPKPTYPSWLTSTPGPRATSPPPGMKPLPARTDQMVYECYDQERGMPCTAVPERMPIRHHPSLSSLPFFSI